MSHWDIPLLLDPRIYTMFLSQRFYIEGRISSILCTERCLSGSCLKWTEVEQKISASPLGMRTSNVFFPLLYQILSHETYYGSQTRME